MFHQRSTCEFEHTEIDPAGCTVDQGLLDDQAEVGFGARGPITRARILIDILDEFVEEIVEEYMLDEDWDNLNNREQKKMKSLGLTERRYEPARRKAKRAISEACHSIYSENCCAASEEDSWDFEGEL